MSHHTTTSGFTLVELSFAIAFLSILLIIIAALISSISAMYQKGTVLKNVNNVGKELLDDIDRSINLASAQDFTVLCQTLGSGADRCIQDNGFKLSFQAATDSDNNQLYGVFCTGSYSYAWNTPAGIKNGFKYNGDDVYLLKISDPNRSVCSANLSGNYNAALSARDFTSGEELLTVSEQQLAFYDLSLYTPSQDPNTKNLFYSGSFVLGTKTGVEVLANEQICSTEGGTASLSSDFNYCAINKFNFAARTTGGQ